MPLRFTLLQTFQDLEAEKAIMGSIVYCIHHKDGCKWSDELRKLKVIIGIFTIALRLALRIKLRRRVEASKLLGLINNRSFVLAGALEHVQARRNTVQQ
jgi:hypothetical protein